MFKRNDELRFKVGDKIRHVIYPNYIGYVLMVNKESSHPYYIKVDTGLEIWVKPDVWTKAFKFDIGDKIKNNGISGILKEFSNDEEYPFIIELKNGLIGKFKSHGWVASDLEVGDKVVFTKDSVGIKSDVNVGEELTIHEIDINDSVLTHACVDKYGQIYWFSRNELELAK